MSEQPTSTPKGEEKEKSPTEEGAKKLKPCCACPETKRARDQCIIENGEENCASLIQDHLTCMRKLGFNI
ncbi:cytochrome c oxidase assembly protein [Daphnia sinensis]|uniref:Cytochrome c oxidase copper chaperone n=1 Tax=Daphnia sinensis TaxID=1820382 RepID=A0AAD5PX77_9CRUS|nr:cytochrome c oxidase assembly protein [Daphnia sinensis]